MLKVLSDAEESIFLGIPRAGSQRLKRVALILIRLGHRDPQPLIP